jgi:hypothetical protein
MWILKKAGDFLAPIITTNSVDEFKSACSTVISHAKSPNADDTTAFIGALNNVQDYLTEELSDDKIDMPCLDHLVNRSVLQRLIDSIDETFPRSHVEPVYNFFLAFIKSDMNRLFAQTSVHRPFTKLLTLLTQLYLLEPSQTREFAIELWNAIKASPLMLELISNDAEYPLVDFFCAMALSPGDDGDGSRKAITSMFVERPLVRFREYVQARFFPQVADFLIATAGCATTFQFSGSVSELTNWLDNILQQTTVFPVDILESGIEEFGDPQQLISVAFVLAFFSAEAIVAPICEYAVCEKTLSRLVGCLKSADPMTLQSAVIFLKILFQAGVALPDLLPPVASGQADMLSVLPPEWLSVGDMEAYETDAAGRVRFFGVERPEGRNPEVFAAVLDLFRRFKAIPIALGLSVTQVITYFVSVAPDVIAGGLADAYAAVVAEFAGIKEIELGQEPGEDSPQFRAAVLAEFGKEVHATFVAVERLRAVAERSL